MGLDGPFASLLLIDLFIPPLCGPVIFATLCPVFGSNPDFVASSLFSSAFASSSAVFVPLPLRPFDPATLRLISCDPGLPPSPFHDLPNLVTSLFSDSASARSAWNFLRSKGLPCALASALALAMASFVSLVASSTRFNILSLALIDHFPF